MSCNFTNIHFIFNSYFFGGVGWIVRDSIGSPIYCDLKQIKRRWSIKSLEATTIWEGLQSISGLLKDNRLPLIVEFDALEVINMLHDKEEDLSKIKNLIEAMKTIVASLGEVEFRHCPRSSNAIAHCVARRAIKKNFVSQGKSSLQEDGLLFWSPVFPCWLNSLLSCEGRCT